MKRIKSIICLLVTFLFVHYANAQRYGNTPSDSAYCVKMLAIFTEMVKQQNLTSAYNSWTILFNKFPMCSQNIYTHGVNVVKNKINNAKNEVERERWIDTLMMVYDNRLKYFAKDSKKFGVGYVLGRKGVDMSKYRPNNIEETYKILYKSIDYQKVESELDVFLAALKTSGKMLKAGLINETAFDDVLKKYLTILDQQAQDVVLRRLKGELTEQEAEKQYESIYMVMYGFALDDQQNQEPEKAKVDPETEAKIRQQIREKMNSQK